MIDVMLLDKSVRWGCPELEELYCGGIFSFIILLLDSIITECYMN